MKVLFFCIVALVSFNLLAQTKDVSSAMSYYTAFVKENKISDIERAYELINKAMSEPQNQKIAKSFFYQGVIVKQYYESKKNDDKASYVALTAQALIKAYRLDKNFDKKEQLLKLMQIVGYDLYSEGIRQHRANQNESAYQLYKDLFQFQSILAENKLDFTLVSANGEKNTLSSKDITNNMVIFCINSGKKEEARALFIEEIERNPSPIAYSKLIQLCYQLEDKACAHKYIEKGLEKYPTDNDLLIYSINRSLDSKEYEKALKQLDVAIIQAPSINLFMVKSQTYENQEKLDLAIDNYRKGLQLFPESFDLNYGIAYALLQTSFKKLNEGDDKTKPQAIAILSEAKKYFTKAKEIDPNKTDFDKIFEQINNVK